MKLLLVVVALLYLGGCSNEKAKPEPIEKTVSEAPPKTESTSASSKISEPTPERQAKTRKDKNRSAGCKDYRSRGN
jgi:hypothetical protein